MQVIGGAAADHFGRRGVLIVGISATIVLFEGLALARSVWLVVALIAFEAAFGWAFFQMAYIAISSDLTSEARRAEGRGVGSSVVPHVVELSSARCVPCLGEAGDARDVLPAHDVGAHQALVATQDAWFLPLTVGSQSDSAHMTSPVAQAPVSHEWGARRVRGRRRSRGPRRRPRRGGVRKGKIRIR